MTNEEINEAVAKKLGCPRIPCEKDDCKTQHYPDYCNDIAAAWKIVENIKYFGNVYDGYWVMYERDNGWDVAIVNRHDGKYFRGSAVTAPMAICKAFLKVPNINEFPKSTDLPASAFHDPGKYDEVE